ncbi:MAG: hypothetical protein DMG98_25545 [Acidobacteria bacterium]|nr:MAG: hypothetical protein DMG98_25545 [Acidobacteriota bacterium]
MGAPSSHRSNWSVAGLGRGDEEALQKRLALFAECNWIYSPQTPEETTKKYLLMAQFKFEQHVCSTYGDQARSA